MVMLDLITITIDRKTGEVINKEKNGTLESPINWKDPVIEMFLKELLKKSI